MTSAPTFIRNQRGLVMLITLISLVILMLAGVALIRSADTNQLLAGNLAFKRDVLNQADKAIIAIKNTVTTGALADSIARQTSSATSNYSATILASNTSGIPNILLNVGAFDATYSANNIVDNTASVTIRYVIDRMCLQTGPVDPASCSLSQSTAGPGGGQIDPNKPGGEDIPIYRLSIRVTGPKNTEAFVQSTFTM